MAWQRKFQNFDDLMAKVTCEVIFFFEVTQDQEFVYPIGYHEADKGYQVEDRKAWAKCQSKENLREDLRVS